MEDLAMTCPNHPHGQVTFTCVRCGRFGCDTCRSPLTGPLCSECGARITSARLPVGETFKESLQFLVRHPKMLGACVAAHAVYGMVLHPLFLYAMRMMRGNLDAVVTALLTLGLIGVLIAFFSTVTEVLLIRYMGDQLQGQERSAGDTVRAALHRLLPGIGSNLLVGLGVGVGTLMFIVPGILLAVLLSLALPAVVLREARVFESLSTSWVRTRGHRLNLFLLLLGCGVIVLVLGLVAAIFTVLVVQMSETDGLIAAMVVQAVWGLSLCLLLSVLVFSDSKLSAPWIRTRKPG